MQATLLRKVVYIVSLVILAVCLYLLGAPAKVVVEQGGDVRAAPGGVLAQYRTQEGLSEAQMGEIDPASSTIKLATFGMRGIAMSLLWHQVMEKQKRHQWNDVVAIANQIIALEPHFETVWVFLGWTLSYNASAEFDDYRERYRWVIRGIDFLISGLKRNQTYPRLYKEVGWAISHKIGMADEVEQYRRLLKDDDDFGQRHGFPLPSDRDNWMLGRHWYHQGEELVLSGGGRELDNLSEFIYFANSRLNLFNYAKWLRKDGIFGEEAMRAWITALDEWKEFGQMNLSTAIPGDGTYRVTKDNRQTVKRAQLNTVDIVKEEEKALLAELNAIAPDLKRELCIARWQQLGEITGQQGSMLSLLEAASTLDRQYYPVEELQIIRQWLEENEPDWRTRLTEDRDSLYPKDQAELRKIPSMFLDEENRDILNKTNEEVAQVRQRAMQNLRVTPSLLRDEIQELEVSREEKNRARAIVEELDGHEARMSLSRTFRGILNYESRFKEVAVESSPLADEAHRLRYEARKTYYEGRLADSLQGWLDAMRKWDELLDLEEFRDRATDADFVRDRIDIAEKFLIILDDSNKIFSDVSDEPVPLRRLMWTRVFQGDQAVADAFAALDYAKKEYEQALAETDATKRKEGLEKAENYFTILARQFSEMNFREKYMEYAPFFDLRDRIIETSAYYIRSLEQQNKQIPEPLPLRSYVELMLRHDPAVESANSIPIVALPFLQEGKYDEAQPVFDEAVAAWSAILDKYPIIAHDPTNPAYGDVERLAMQYAEVLRAQDKPVPDDFPLKAFLR